MTSTKKTWLSILIAAVIIIGMFAAAVVGGTAFFIYRHVHTQFTPSDDAERQFAEARSRFAGQQPLLEIRRDDQAVVHRSPASPRRDLTALHALAYDPSAHKLVHVDIPIWLLRLVPAGGTIHISDVDELDTINAKLTLEDLERHGPGLVMDLHRQGESQVLVWTE